MGDWTHLVIGLLLVGVAAVSAAVLRSRAGTWSEARRRHPDLVILLGVMSGYGLGSSLAALVPSSMTPVLIAGYALLFVVVVAVGLRRRARSRPRG